MDSNPQFPDPFHHCSQVLFFLLIFATVDLISPSAPLISAVAHLIFVTDPPYFEDLQYKNYFIVNSKTKNKQPVIYKHKNIRKMYKVIDWH